MNGAAWKWFRSLTTGLAGLVYLSSVLLWNVSMPTFGAVVIGLAGYELLDPPHRRR